MKLKNINKEKCIIHSYILNDDKYSISKHVKSVILPKDLADLLLFIKKREIRINDIGKWIMSKNPFVINFDFSEASLNQNSSFMHIIGNVNEDDLLFIKLQIIDILKVRFNRLLDDKKKITTEEDVNLFNRLLDSVFECELHLQEINKNELSNRTNLSKIWSSYLTYLLTKEEIMLEVDYSVTRKLKTIIKDIKKKGILENYGEKNISEIPINHLYMGSPKECYDVEIKESEDKSKSTCTYRIRESVNLKFRLRNNGSDIEAISDVLYVDDKPFSFVINIRFDDSITDECEIKLFISSTSWVNEQFNETSQLKLKTKNKVSLYICPNSSSNYHIRLEILNKSDKDNLYNKFLSQLDMNILNKITNNTVNLENILRNTTTYLDNERLKKGQAFIGIPVSAPIRSEAKNAQLPGVAIKDKDAFLELVHNILLDNKINIKKSKELPIVSESVVDTFEAKPKKMDIEKITANNSSLEQINICYWTHLEDNFNLFKNFMENIETKGNKKNPTTDLFSCQQAENEYSLKLDNKEINVKLFRMDASELTILLEAKDKYPNNNDKRIRVSKNKKIIETEFSKYDDIDFNNSDEIYTMNILEIDDFHNQYTLAKYDPSDTIKQAFLEMNHTVQRINEVAIFNRRLNEAKAQENEKRIKTLSASLEKKLPNIYKSALLDTFSKKGITVEVKDEELHEGTKEIYGFMTETIGNNKVYIMSKINKEGYFIKDISKIEVDKSRQRNSRRGNNIANSNDSWVPAYKLTEVAQKYTGRIKTSIIEESELWSIIEENIDLNPETKKVLFISASERVHLTSLRNDNISNSIKIFKNIKNISLVRVNELYKDVPFGAIYKSSSSEPGIWSPSHNQGLCIKSKNLYYDIGSRGDAMQIPLGTSKLTVQDSPLAKKRPIEFYIVSNNEDLYYESALLASGLRKVNIAFDSATNLPMPLFIIKNISKELSFLMNYNEDEESKIEEISCEEANEIVPLDWLFKKVEDSEQQTLLLS